MKNKFTIRELENGNIEIFEEREVFPMVFITKSKIYHLYIIKEICTAKDKRLALKIAKNTIKLISMKSK